MKIKLVLFVAIIAGLVALFTLSFREQFAQQQEATIVNSVNEEDAGNNPKPKSNTPITAVKSLLSIKAFPNPADSYVDVAVSLEDMRDITLKVMDLTGKIITTKVVGYLTKGDHIVNLETSQIKSGIYVLTGSATGTTGDVFIGKIKLVIRH